MKKQDILKMLGLTEAEFYKLYPTEESYRKAVSKQFGGGLDPKSYSEKVRAEKYKYRGDVTAPRVNPVANTVTYPQTDAQGHFLDSRQYPWLVKQMTTGPGSLTGIPAQPAFTPQYGTGVSEADQLAAFLKANPMKAEGGPINALNPWAPDFFNPEYLMKKGGMPCFNCGGSHMQQGGIMSADMQGQYPTFNQGGMDTYQYGGDPSIPAISSKQSLAMFRDIIKKMGGPAYPGQTQDNIIESKKNDFLHYIRNNTMDAIAREENDNMMSMYFQFGGIPFAQYGIQKPDYNQTQYIQYDENGNPVTAEEVYSPQSKKNVQNMYQQPQQQQPGSFSITTPSGTEMAQGIMTAFTGAAGMINNTKNRKAEEAWRRSHSDPNNFMPISQGNDRGDYDQFGNIRPDAKVPVQFPGYNVGERGTPYQFQEGGEYYMTDDEIASIMKAGGQIDFLD